MPWGVSGAAFTRHMQAGAARPPWRLCSPRQAASGSIACSRALKPAALGWLTALWLMG